MTQNQLYLFKDRLLATDHHTLFITPAQSYRIYTAITVTERAFHAFNSKDYHRNMPISSREFRNISYFYPFSLLRISKN